MVGYTVSKRVGNAVKRNRAKRRIRNLVREFSPEFVCGYYFVFMATSETPFAEYPKLKSDFVYCLRKSKERCDRANCS
jgi:ribonuclease P protein component